MLRSRLFMLMLAALLIAQSAFGSALHRCHGGLPPGTADHAPASMVAIDAGNDEMPCHSQTAADETAELHISTDHHAATAHGFCACSIAHCAPPGVISQFELAAVPVHTASMPLYRFVVLTAPAETLLRPPITLS